MKKVSMALVMILAVMLVVGIACDGNGNIEPTPTPTATPTATPTPTPEVQSDDRIGFIVNNIERTYIYPDEMEGAGVLNTGYNFVVIYLSLATVEGGQVGNMGQDTSLFDSAGHKYDYRGLRWIGISFSDLSNLTSSMVAIAGRTSGIIVFSLPLQSQPEILRLDYEFSLDLEEPTEYHIDINLQ